jgi:hypothetical protein
MQGGGIPILMFDGRRSFSYSPRRSTRTSACRLCPRGRSEHCSTFSLVVYLCIFCPPDCSRTRHESWTTFRQLSWRARATSQFTWLKLVASPVRAKRLQWKMALKLRTLSVNFHPSKSPDVIFGSSPEWSPGSNPRLINRYPRHPVQCVPKKVPSIEIILLL